MTHSSTTKVSINPSPNGTMIFQRARTLFTSDTAISAVGAAASIAATQAITSTDLG